MFFSLSFVGALFASPVLAACNQTLSVGANVAAAVASAPDGSTICLNSGDYGAVAFTNITRSGFVTLQSTTGVDARLRISEVYNSRFIRFSRLTIAGAGVHGCSVSIEIWNSTFVANTSGLFYNQSGCSALTDMALVVDGVTFDRVSNALWEGRLSISGVRGITIRNSIFSGVPTSNQSDGIMIGGGSQSVTIGPGNVFRDIVQSACGGVHCDAIQAYTGGAGTVITGNYFFNNSVHIGIYDGGSPSAAITNNVFDTNPGGQVLQTLQIGGIQGMLMEHNTFRNVTLGIGTKSANQPHSGWIVQNNIFDQAYFTASGDQPGCGADCVMRFNLKSNGGTTTPTGTNNLTGTAVYVGAGSVSSWSNWRLVDGSVGKGAANDGRDMGTNYYGPDTLAPAPPRALRTGSP